MKRTLVVIFCLSLFSVISSFSQFIHPGITHKKSDLDRMKYMVEAQIDPWYSSYQEMVSDSKSSYDYEVRGDVSFTEIGRDNGVNYGSWNSDIRAAYYNAIRYYVSGDERHAQKAVEIFNSWVGVEAVTSNGTQALSGGVGYIMIEAAEIIKHTYSGWSEVDRKKFEDMLVFPGYSNTAVPNGVSRTYGSFYWQAYQGDAGRHGNQGLSGWRTVMAIGIFLDNEIIYDRALRYIQGLPHRSDDLPYPAGAPTSNSITSSDEYSETWSTSRGSSIEDYGYNELMTNYIWDNGQCQESSRDQQHVMFGLGLLTSMSEMAWNQGDDLYGFEDSRLLFGLEYSMRYNISSIASYPDQTTHWEPTVESGEFLEGFDRTGRWYSKAISPIGIAGISSRPVFEMSTAHYLGRGLKTEEEAKWITRTRDLSIELYGYEGQGWTNDAIGWGGLTARRPELCYGDPINGFSSGMPDYNMHVLPTTIEAENYDYFILNGNGKTYYDNDAGNGGNQYRLDEDVDIEVCTEGGFNVTSMEPNEWLTYTVYVPATGTYDLSVRYSANGDGGAIGFSFGGEDKTGEVTTPSTSGEQNWSSLTVAEGVLLAKGVQSLRLDIKGIGAVININNFTISTSTSCVLPPSYVNQLSSFLEPGIKFNYYEGDWNFLPDFESQTVLDSGIATMVELGNGEQDDYFGFVFDGYLEIETEGDYTFYTYSDDGTKLYIDGALIVINDGTHGAQEEQGSICLQSGFHEIKVEYFDKVGTNDVLEVSYEGPGISKQEIEALYYLPNDLPTDCNGDVNGNASIDACGVCSGGNSGITVDACLICEDPFASSVDGLNVPGNVLDDSLETRWSAFGVGEYIELCVGEDPIFLESVDIAFYVGDTRTTTFDIEVSSDGINWEAVLENAVSSGGTLEKERFTFQESEVWKIRLVGKGNSINDWNSITEISWNEVITSTSNDDLVNKIKIFPNPFEDKIVVTNQLGKRIKIEVFSGLGKHIYSSEYFTSDIEIDLNNEDVGVYFLQITNDLEVVTRQVIKK